MKGVLRTLRLRGLGYLIYVFVGVVVPQAVRPFALWCSGLSRRALGVALLGGVALAAVAGWLWAGIFGAALPPAAAVGAGLVLFAIRHLRRVRKLAQARARSARVLTARDSSASGVAQWHDSLLGRVDNDGRLLPVCGAASNLTPVDQRDFVPRYRFALDLVQREGETLVRKGFRGNRCAFEREWLALVAIGGRANAPLIVSYDEKSLTLWREFVPGASLRDLLVGAGARILTTDVSADAELAELDPAIASETVWARGRDRMSAAVGDDFVGSLERELDRVHACGVTGFSLTFGNVVVHEATGAPWFIDFDRARVHSSPSGWGFRVARDRDRRLFSRIYGLELVTEGQAGELLAQVETGYAPVDLGGGVVSPGFWSVDSGTGRWEAVNHGILTPVLAGRRVLDLGSHNGTMALMMLRAGAASVVAVEREPRLVESARRLRRLFEWRDLRRYELHLRCEDMLSAVTGSLPDIDVVTAFCSLYYLTEADMLAVARRASELAPVLVLQAKTDTRSDASERKASKSSVEFLRSVATEAGFEHVEVLGPSGYTRPILVCRKGNGM